MRTNPPPTSPSHHLPQLDALRGFAAAIVFAFHWYWLSFTATSNPHLVLVAKLLSPLGYGDSGVPIFFVLSGFCIHLAFCRAPARNFSTPQFFHRRFFRIFPAYLLWLAIFSLCHPTRPSPYAPAAILAHALMLQNFSPQYFLQINSSFWSLAVEWQFYLAYPLLLLLRRFLGMPRATLLAFALSATYCLALTITGQHSPFLVRCLLASYAQWTLGALLAERFVAGKPILLPPRITLSLAIPAALLLTGREDQWASLAWSLAAASTLDWWIRQQHFLPPRPLVFLGSISYSFYLIHEPILEYLTQSLGRPDVPHIFLIFAASLALTIIAAWATYRLIELPAISFSRRAFKVNPFAPNRHMVNGLRP
jgi:peptidoglycan/LPS O-acetylase OafA/YrhL